MEFDQIAEQAPWSRARKELFFFDPASIVVSCPNFFDPPSDDQRKTQEGVAQSTTADMLGQKLGCLLHNARCAVLTVSATNMPLHCYIE